MADRIAVHVPADGYVVQTGRDLGFSINVPLGEEFRLEIDADGEVRVTVRKDERPRRRRGRLVGVFMGA